MAARKKKPTVANVRNELTDEQRSGSDKIISQCKEIENRCSEVMKDWKRSLATIHGMLGDFCGLAHAVDPYPLDSNQWTIYFPSGSLSAKKYCESRISVLKEAVARTVGRPIQLRLVVTGNCQAAPDAKPELMKSNSFARGDIKAARPTEYKGVVYRSKSEAMFARYLDLNHWAHWFEYEPQTMAVDDWTPDFVACRVFHPILNEPQCSRCGKAHGMKFEPFICEECGLHCTNYKSSGFAVSSSVIEYKPSIPTKTYIDECFAKFFKLFERLNREIGESAYGFDFEIYFGSPYSESDAVGKVITTSVGRESLTYHLSMEDWIGAHRSDLLAYRFDLES